MKKNVIIGVTGPTGTGKSVFCRLLQEKGYTVLDADKIYKELISGPSACTAALKREFGANIGDDKGGIDRKKLGLIAFSDSEELARLNAVAHPFVVDEIDRMIAAKTHEGVTRFAVDAPALFESGADQMCDITVAVLASRDLRLNRIKSRDALDDESALLRMGAQHGDEYYSEKSEYIIVNDGKIDSFEASVDRFLAAIGEKADEKRR